MLSRKPGVWYGFQKPALVLANDVIFLATPSLSKDCTKCVQWIECQLSASQRMFLDYELRLCTRHREITIKELQSLVVFGCTALLFMVGATASTHDREEGWDNFLFVYTE